MTALLVALIYAAGCLGAGLLVVRALTGRAWPALAADDAPLLATGFILGQALVAGLWIPIALGGWFRPVILGVLSLALAAAAVTLALPLARTAWERADDALAWLRAQSLVVRAAAITLAALVLGFGLAAWLKPPIGDAEAFYLVYARIIAATERLEPMPGLYEGFSAIGLMGEMHMAALVALADVRAAKFFVWLLGLATAALLVSVCGAVNIGRLGKLLALALLFTSTAFTYHLFDGKVDLFAAALGLVAVWWVLAERDAVLKRVAIAVAGLATGFAVVAKFSFGLGFVPAIATLLVWRRLDASGGASIGPLLGTLTTFVAWAVLATAPHLVKNAVLFAAPLAPFVGGPYDKSWLQQVWFAPEVTRRIVLTYPLALVFGRYPMQGGNLSFLLLALLPLAWWLPRPARWRSSTVLQLCVAGAVGTLLWMALRPSVIAPRYFLTTLLLFYPLVAKAADYVLTHEARPRWLGAAAMAFVLLALAVFAYPLLPVARYAAAAARGTGDECALASPYCVPLSRLSREALPGDRVYLAGYYGYWLRDDLLQCRDRGDESRLPRLGGGPGISWEALAQGGFRWLVVDLSSHGQEWETLAGLPRPDYLAAETFWHDNRLLVLRLTDRRRPERVACAQVDGRAWMPLPAQ